MTALRSWGMAVASMIAGCALVNALLAVLIRSISPEYLVVMGNLPYEAVWRSWWPVFATALGTGAKMGVVPGAFLGMCAVIGVRQTAPWVNAARGGTAALLAGIIGASCAGAGALLLGRWGMVKLPVEIDLLVGHPYRVLLACGLEHGALAGGALGTLVAGIVLYRSRGTEGVPSGSGLRFQR